MFHRRNPDWKKHSVVGLSEYQSWRTMIQRCTNPNHKAFPRYGGRGIAICARWRVFENFLADMGWRPPGRQLDRIKNDKGYEPGNCRWATPSQNSNNKEHNFRIEYNGRIQTSAEWAQETGILRQVIRARLKLGWPLDQVFSLQDYRYTSHPKNLSIGKCAVAKNRILPS